MCGERRVCVTCVHAVGAMKFQCGRHLPLNYVHVSYFANEFINHTFFHQTFSPIGGNDNFQKQGVIKIICKINTALAYFRMVMLRLQQSQDFPTHLIIS